MLSVGRLMEDQQIIKSVLPEKPLVSVIMPTYCRREDSLRKSIESVLAQTFTNFEFIIIDDGSRDGTLQILLEYQKLDHRIMIIRHYLNCGLPAVRVNEGLMLARGKYIAYQFDDDEWLPNCLQILVDKIERKPYECVVYGVCEAIVDDGRGNSTKMLLGTQVDNCMLNNRNYIANNSVLHHRSILELTGLYDPNIVLRRCCDYDLWIRMSKFVPFIFVDQVVSKVNAGKKDSLGVDENLSIIKMSNIRIMLEINRNDKLKANVINNYHVDDMTQYHAYFSERVIDKINRISIIPYRCKVSYYLKQAELCVASLTRPAKKMMAVVKKAYSKTVDIIISNFTKRLDKFPYNQFFIIEDELYFLKPEDHDLLVAVGEADIAFERYLTKYKKDSIPVINVLEDNMFYYYEKDRNSWNSQWHEQLMQQMVKGPTNILCYDHDSNKQESSTWFKRIHTNIPDRYFVLKKKETANDKLKIALYANNHLENELRLIYTAFKSLKQLDKLELHIWGSTSVPFNQLPCSIKNRSFNKNFENHLQELKSYYYDYYICPYYEENYLHGCKSILAFIEGTAMGGVGIFSKRGPFAAIPDELCFKADLSQWSQVLQQVIDLPEEKRYDIYYQAYYFIRKNHLTENQAYKFLSYLDVTLLHKKVKSNRIAYFIANNATEQAIESLILYGQIIKDYGFEVTFCLSTNPSDKIQNAIAQSNLSINYHRFEYALLDREQGNLLAQWLQAHHIGLVHSAGYLPTVGHGCQVAQIPHISSLYDYEKQIITKENIQQFPVTNYIHTTSNYSGAMWSDYIGVPFCKVVFPVETYYFELYEIKRIQKNEDRKKVLISGQISRDLVRQQLTNQGLNDRIEVIEIADIKPEVYATIDFLISIQFEEGINKEMLRSMASGVMVLALKSMQSNEIIKAGYNGMVFEHPTVEAIIDCLKQAIAVEDSIKEEILYNAYHTAMIVCKKEFIISELIHIYNEAVDSFNDLLRR